MPWWASSAIAPASSTPVGPPPNDGEGRERLATVSVFLVFSAFKIQQDAPADIGRVLNFFETRRKRLPGLIAEIAVPGARRDDQMIVIERAPVFQHDAVFIPLHICDPAHQNPCVRLVAEEFTDRRGDISQGTGQRSRLDRAVVGISDSYAGQSQSPGMGRF